MDKYAIICIFTLVTLCTWHAGLGALIFILTIDFRVTPDMWLVYIDQCFFTTAISIFILIHAALLVWLYYVPLEYRRQMTIKDCDYRHSICNEKKNLEYTPISM